MEKPNNTNPPAYQDEEITLKELIEKILEFWYELWNKKWWIILITLPFVIFFAYNAKNTEVTYPAALTYTLNDGSGGGGAIAGILGSFGLGKGGKVNLDKIVALSKSRNIIQKVLFTQLPLDTLEGKKDFVANHLIELYKWDLEWAENKPEFSGFRFKADNIQEFSPLELNVLKMVYGKVVGGQNVKNPIFSNGFNEDTGILTISATTVDEQLSIDFCNLAFQELKNYYTLNSTNPQKNTFEFVQAKTDSIVNLLRSKEFQLARFNDENRNLSDPGRLVQRKILETEIGKLKLMYAETTKNYELADFSLQNSTPDIAIIDEPLPPLEPIMKSLLIELIKGGLLGGLIAAGFFIGRKIVLDAMK
ncbi:MAG: hypothetical protein IPM42_10165 [Saprospiraceae bacterium]|nr:hypothetical protein [Saprospiraceae bacterium]